MIALQIADIRHFMKKLLLSESFDRVPSSGRKYYYFLYLSYGWAASESLLYRRRAGTD